MAWDTDATLMLRILVDDYDAPQTYTDAKLKTVLIISAKMVQQDTNFSDYTVSVSAQTITPDPTDPSSQNNDFVNLMVTKAACILTRAEYKAATNESIYVDDANTRVDGREKGKQKGDLASNYCKEYSDMLLSYEMGNGTSGVAIVTPTTSRRR